MTARSSNRTALPYNLHIDNTAARSHKKQARLPIGKRACAAYIVRPGSVAEDAHHRAVALLLGEETGVVFVVTLVAVNDNVFRGGDQTVLNAAEAAQRLLVGARMEETDVLRLTGRQFRQEDRIGVGLAAVIVLAVAREAAEEHPLVLLVPVVDSQQRVTLIDTPDVRQRRHERTVDHVPALAVVLLLLVDDREEGRTALAHREGTELGEEIGLLHPVGVAHVLDLCHDLLGHVFVVVVEGQ